MLNKIILFGASGYTGRNTAEMLVRKGSKPVLAGRNRETLKNLAGRLGGLDIAEADVNRPDSLRAMIGKGDVLVSTVGPFTVYGEAALSAAVEKGAHYIDSTGEPGFIAKVFEAYGRKAQDAGTILLTACGYDYVPGNCAAGLALEKAGDNAARVDVGYYIVGKTALDMSQGTAASVRYSILEPGKTWRDGALVSCYGGSKLRSFKVAGKNRPGILIPTTECYSLPKVYSRLKDVNVYLGWFGAFSYGMRAMSGFNTLMLKIPGYKAMLKGMISLTSGSKGKGPDQTVRDDTGSHIVAEAYDSQGHLLSRSDLVGANGYDFTFRILAWAAEKLAKNDHLAVSGAAGPIEIFGLPDLVEGCRQAGLQER